MTDSEGGFSDVDFPSCMWIEIARCVVCIMLILPSGSGQVRSGQRGKECKLRSQSNVKVLCYAVVITIVIIVIIVIIIIIIITIIITIIAITYIIVLMITWKLLNCE